jgi:hypothetical protein
MIKDSPLTRLIKKSTVGDKMDLKRICDKLSITLQPAPDLQDLCHIIRDEKTRKPVIKLNTSIDSKTRFTLVAIAAAEFILHAERINGGGIKYDMFALTDIHHKKHTPYIMLATRLAIPEHIIEKLVYEADNEFVSKHIRDREDHFDSNAYIENSLYLPQFIRCAVKESSGKLLLDNIEMKNF